MVKKYAAAVMHIRKLVESSEFAEKYKAKPGYFTRSSAKLRFPILMYIIMSLSKKPAQLKLDLFFGTYNKLKKTNISVYASSFFEARLKILPAAFEALNEKFILWFYQNDKQNKKFHGFNIFGVDGSVFEIPANPKLKAYFEYKSMNPDTTTVRACANVIYDVCNKMTVFACLDKYTKSERISFVEMFDKFKETSLFGRKNIFVFDRGFPSNELITYLNNNNTLFLFRTKNNSFKFLNDDNGNDAVLDYVSYNKKYSYKIRVITVTLPSGEIEKLITNIFDGAFDSQFFKELYFLRWGVEGNYNYLKNKLAIEDFQSANLTALQQNFHATVLMSNLTALAASEVSEIISGCDSGYLLKHQYQANLNYVIGRLFDEFISFFMRSRRFINCLFADILCSAQKVKVPIRPNRHVKRPNKMKKVDKFFFNYRNLL